MLSRRALHNDSRIASSLLRIHFQDPFESYRNEVLKSLTFLFSSVVTVAFQITFRAEIYINNFFYFLKIIFNIAHQNNSKHTNYIKF